MGYALALLSALLSGVGAVYTEWVLKRNGDALQWQCMQLYGLGVLVNALGLGMHGGMGRYMRVHCTWGYTQG